MIAHILRPSSMNEESEENESIMASKSFGVEEHSIAKI